MYSGHFQQIMKSSLQGKSCVAAFLIRNVCSKTVVFKYQKVAKFTKRTEKEWTFHFAFERVALFTIFTSREIMESLAQFYAQKDRTEIVPSHLVKKSTFKGGMKIVPSRFLSHSGSHINNPWKHYKLRVYYKQYLKIFPCY